MGKKDKKKQGKGAEKTAHKTEKKTLQKIKKELAAKGEDDIQKLIAEYRVKGSKVITEELCPQPSPRSGFSFCAHPDKDELVLFGGEYFNGSQTTMYDDLYFYNIKKNQWSLLQCPEKPPPRCSHQAVVVSQCGGQMWLFGGEFASPSRSTFHHFRDLWAFHFRERRWAEVKAEGAPPSRSGHRMVATKKMIVLFGGFHESLQDYKYFDDTWVFSLESYTWSRLDVGGRGPSPRSGCLLGPLLDGRILLYGGYTREKVKKDVDKGIAHTDMYYLQLDERTSPPKWKWVGVKPSGCPPSARSGFFSCLAPNDLLLAFGGVHDDHPDEEQLTSVFHDDLYSLEMGRGRWNCISLRGGGGEVVGRRRRREKGGGGAEEEEKMDDEEMEETSVKTYDDSIFTVKIGPSTSAQGAPTTTPSASTSLPPARMSANLAVKGGVLYLYGGQVEEGGRQLTLSDFYALDVHKMDAWRTIVPFSTSGLEWMESSEDETSSDGEESGESEEEEEMDTQ